MRTLCLMLCLLGCGEQSNCEKSCEATKQCPQAPTHFAALECDDACDYQEGLSTDYGCRAQWDTFVACGAANVDRACEPGTCGTEAMAWSNCFPPD